MLTAEENVKLPLSVAGTKADPGWFKDLIAKVGLTDRLGHRPSELSGGQQQRVAVARSLVSKPTVVFADEPTGNLDSRSSDEILKLLRDSCDSYGQTIVMVTHDPRAAAIADRILYLADGKIVLDQKGATAAEVLQTMNELDSLAARPPRDSRRAEGPARAQAPARAHLARDRDGRGDGERHLRPHRHDQQRLHGDLHDRDRRRGRGRHRQGGLRRLARTRRSFPASTLGEDPGAPRRRGRGGRDRRPGPVRRRETARLSQHGGAPGLAFSVDPAATPASTRPSSSRGNWPIGPHEVAMDAHTADAQHFKVGEHGRRDPAAGRSSATGSAASSDSGTRPRSAARRSRSSTSRPRRRCSTSTASSTRSTSRRSRGSRSRR